MSQNYYGPYCDGAQFFNQYHNNIDAQYYYHVNGMPQYNYYGNEFVPPQPRMQMPQQNYQTQYVPPSTQYSFQIENSTLVPTAAEFVPSWLNKETASATTSSETEKSCSSDTPPNDVSSTIDDLTNLSLNTSNKTDRDQRVDNNQRGSGNTRITYKDSRNDYRENDGYRNNHRPRYENNYNNNRYNSNYRYEDNSRYNNNRSRNTYKKDNGKPLHKSKSGIQSGVQSSSSAESVPDSKIEKLSQRDNLSHEIDSGKLECLVCCENIKPYQSIWSCSNCYHILHLNCTIKWAHSSKSDDGWRCPACQNVSQKIPRDYYCFCGKTQNPQNNYNDLAHSCGELCQRKNGCEHSCTQLCHPGPCPPCQATVTRYCGCGKTNRIMQCNQKNDIVCEQICDKLLCCELHDCKLKCHHGDCEMCSEKFSFKCYCGKNTREVPCDIDNTGLANYSCEKICNRMLSCQNHRCLKICHSGECGDCKFAPETIKSCPCGKTRIVAGQRKSCVDPVPTCNRICKKPLSCGARRAPHLCTGKCHSGNCLACNKETAVKCRCGQMDQMVKCRELQTRADDARCKKRCTKKRNCGKHKCNQECCIDIDHICPIPCNHQLTCGKHKCDKPCHKGRCPPCYRSSFEELHCECGANVIFPPVPCGTKRPECENPCTRQHPCDHPVQHNCHSATTCPPCMILTTKYCHGKHEQRKTIPCSQEDFSCGMPCNKPLPCNRHKCIRSCHKDNCTVEGEVCKQNCNTTRTTCAHKCNAPCHENECPDTPCRETVEVTCQCGHRKQTRTCNDFAKDFRRIATANLASSMQEMQRGQSVELSDIFGPVRVSTSSNKTLECTEECRVVDRNRRLDIALQIRNPDMSSKLQPKYSDYLRSWGKKDPKFTESVHDKLSELVKLSKESKQKSRSHSFPTMNRDKRQVVHEMCSMFGVESVAYDAEPNRNVVATAFKDRSWLPAMSILEVLQREGGQRRIPVPQNAWGIKK